MTKEVRILLLEDIPNDADLIKREIERAGLAVEIRRVNTAHDFLYSLTESWPDVILSGYRVSGISGMESLSLAREHSPAIPFIFVTGALSEEIVVECMKGGAWDYILKEHLIRLGPAIVSALEKKRLLEEKSIAESALAKSKDFYLRILEVSPALVWRSDPEGRIAFFNRNWLLFTGKDMFQLLDEGWLESIHPADIGDVKTTMLQMIRSKTAFEIEFRMRRYDGEYRWIQNFIRPFSDDQGELSGCIGYCFDITERYETEKVLQKLSRAVEQSKTAIIITDIVGRIEYANSSYVRMTGYRLDEIIGKNPKEELGMDFLPDIFDEPSGKKGFRGEWRGEVRSRRENGETYWGFVTVSPISNGDDEVTHYLVEAEDITLRKEAEIALEESRMELSRKHEELRHLFGQVARSKQDWESTFDCIGDILILADSHGRIKRCNAALREITSLAYTQIIGKSLRDFLSLHGLTLPEDISSDHEIFHKESGRWFVCRSYPFTDGESMAPSGFVLSIHDNTEQKRMREELERAYMDLKATQATILHQEKMASIGQLAAGVAHEINNPMGFISSNLGTLGKYMDKLSTFTGFIIEALQSSDDRELKRAIEEKKKALKVDYVMNDGAELIKESLEGAERVRTIVQNLKSFSRVDETECKPADINECLESTINIVWNELKYKVNLIRELGEIPMTRCYPQQINQVFMNLLVNASHAIEKRGEIRIRTWHDNSNIYASVSDNGCGIPESVQNRIFEPFFTTKEVGKGTGLGLSITYDIMRKHNGDISVESKPGEGTTMTIRLPIV